MRNSIFFLVIWFLTSQMTCNKYQQPGVWITIGDRAIQAKDNLWIGFSKDFEVSSTSKQMKIQVAADSKYWLWVNDSLLVREGGLKWGPDPQSVYVDTIDIGPATRPGKNTLAIAVWHFGKSSFSHKDSGLPVLYMHSNDRDFQSDTTWLVGELSAFKQESSSPRPNWRLAESNINFDANKSQDFLKPLFGQELSQNSTSVVADSFDYQLVQRPIPQWKDYGLQEYVNPISFPVSSIGDTLLMDLPYNAQVTPYFVIDSPEEGLVIDIRTDNYKGGSEYNVRTNYTTRLGEQVFETPGWMNGHTVRYYFPEGVLIKALKFRETGYNTEFAGSFTCNDPFLNTLWQKSRRTLYLTMRDNFMDCPDRERAQWWGDAVIQIQQCFYAFDDKSHGLAKKAILELVNWQKKDSTIFSPIPAGTWDKELPTQMLASVGRYGFWEYFRHTKDTATIAAVYDDVKAYIDIWETDESGLVIPRKGGWTWGDWGNNKDMPLIFNGWYYLALDGLARMADLTNHKSDAVVARAKMQKLKQAWNDTFWTGNDYRSPDYEGETDERGHALAVVSGIAPIEYHSEIKKVLITGRHCSPYFEKYVLEALFQMGEGEAAIVRMKDRYKTMVESPVTTLWEGWQVGSSTWGGGTYNHSWSGGPLTLLSQYVAGIDPERNGNVDNVNLYQLEWVKAKAWTNSRIVEIDSRKK